MASLLEELEEEERRQERPAAPVQAPPPTPPPTPAFVPPQPSPEAEAEYQRLVERGGLADLLQMGTPLQAIQAAAETAQAEEERAAIARQTGATTPGAGLAMQRLAQMTAPDPGAGTLSNIGAGALGIATMPLMAGVAGAKWIGGGADPAVLGQAGIDIARMTAEDWGSLFAAPFSGEARKRVAERAGRDPLGLALDVAIPFNVLGRGVTAASRLARTPRRAGQLARAGQHIQRAPAHLLRAPWTAVEAVARGAPEATGVAGRALQRVSETPLGRGARYITRRDVWKPDVAHLLEEIEAAPQVGLQRARQLLPEDASPEDLRMLAQWAKGERPAGVHQRVVLEGEEIMPELRSRVGRRQQIRGTQRELEEMQRQVAEAGQVTPEMATRLSEFQRRTGLGKPPGTIGADDMKAWMDELNQKLADPSANPDEIIERLARGEGRTFFGVDPDVYRNATPEQRQAVVKMIVRMNAIGVPVIDAHLRIGAQLAEQGLLRRGQFAHRATRYTPDYYFIEGQKALQKLMERLGIKEGTKEARAMQAEFAATGVVRGKGAGISPEELGFQRRAHWKDLPLEEQEKRGLLPLQKRVAIYMAQTETVLAKQRVFSELAEMFKDYPKTGGQQLYGPLQKMQNDPKRWGDLAGEYIPRDIKQLLNGLDPEYMERQASKWYNKWMNWWKKAHTVWSPATQIRNVISAMTFQSEMGGFSLLSPGGGFRNLRLLGRTAKEFWRGEGDLIRRFEATGALRRNFNRELARASADAIRPLVGAKRRMKDFFDVLIGGQETALRYADRLAREGKKLGRWRALDQMLESSYGGLDDLFKTAKFGQIIELQDEFRRTGRVTGRMRRSLGPRAEEILRGGDQAAARQALDTYVDYSRSRFSAAGNMIRSSPLGVPFYSFNSRMIPRFFMWMAEEPIKARLFQITSQFLDEVNLLSQGVHPQELAEIFGSQLPWQQARSTYVGRDEDGDPIWLDLGGYTPVAGLFQPTALGEQRLNPLDLLMFQSPAAQMAAAVTSGEDPHTGQPLFPLGERFDPTEGQHWKGLFQYGARQVLPTPAVQLGRVLQSAIEGPGPVERGMKRPWPMMLARMAGIPLSGTYRGAGIERMSRKLGQLDREEDYMIRRAEQEGWSDEQIQRLIDYIERRRRPAIARMRAMTPPTGE